LPLYFPADYWPDAYFPDGYWPGMSSGAAHIPLLLPLFGVAVESGRFTGEAETEGRFTGVAEDNKRFTGRGGE